MPAYRTPALEETNKFHAAMAQRTDSELVALLGEPAENWREEALEAAKLELAKRNLTPDHHQHLASAAVKAAGRNALALEGSIRALAFLLGISMFAGFAIIGIFTHYEKRGQRRRAKEALAWYLYGFGVTVTCFVFGILQRC